VSFEVCVAEVVQIDGNRHFQPTGTGPTPMPQTPT
jgi:hypothetical protein